MEFRRRTAGKPERLAILSGSFHPPTRAHMALAQAGLAYADEVLFVLPRQFPHKRYEGVGLEDRLRMLDASIGGFDRYCLAVTEGGLFADIARECREAYGGGVALKFLCGSDAAERFLNWDYGRAAAPAEMLQEFELLVAARGDSFQPPPELAGRIRTLPFPPEYREDSATEVRRRIAAGEPWEHLAPPGAVELIREIYTAALRRGALCPETP